MAASEPSTFVQARLHGGLYRRIRRSPFLSVFVVPLAAVGLAVAVRGLLEIYLQAEAPVLLFPPAVMVAAWTGGFRGGLFATFLSVLAGSYFFLDPKESFSVSSASDAARLLLLAGVGVGISVGGARLHRTRAELLRSEYHLSRVLDSLFAFVGVLTPDGLLVQANRAPLEAAGIAAGEVLGRPFWETFWWNYSPEVQAQLKSAVEKAQRGEPSRYDVDVRMRGGQLMTIDFSLTPMRDESGQITHLIPSGVPITERKRVEREMRESEERLRLAQEAARVGSWALDTGTRRITWGPEVYELYGLAPDAEPAYDTWRAAVHPEDRDRAAAAVQATLHSGEPLDIEFRVLRGGEVRWIAGKGRLMPGSGGTPGRLVGVHMDITARKQADQALRESEERFRGTFDNAAVGMSLVGLDGRWLRVNDRLCQITGYTREEMLARTFADISHADDVERDWIQKRELTAGRIDSYSMEKRYIRKDGAPMWVNLTVSLMRDGTGAPRSYISVIEDITARKTAEAALKRSETQLRQVADTMPQLVWVTAASGYHEWFNRRWYDYTGLDFDSSKGERWDTVLHPDDQAEARDRWRHSLGSGDPYEGEYRCRRFDGAYRWFLGRALAIRDQEGQIVRWFGTFTDIHDYRTALDRLARANEDLQEFGWAASHDLQEPLRMVMSFTQLLERHYGTQLDAKGKQFIQHAVNGARRMEALLAGLREYWQASEHHSGEPEWVEMEKALGESLENLSLSLAEAKAEVTHGRLPLVPGQQVHLVQLLQNLIGNAVKYRHPERAARVHVSAQRDGAEWRFSVSDNGIGIPDQYREHIFGLFKRLHRADEYPGTGIGLALCETIVKRLGGRIWVDSEAGAGSTFYFTLPAHSPAAPRAERQVSA